LVINNISDHFSHIFNNIPHSAIMYYFGCWLKRRGIQAKKAMKAKKAAPEAPVAKKANYYIEQQGIKVECLPSCPVSFLGSLYHPRIMIVQLWFQKSINRHQFI
jgi:hypothetical protein